MLGDIEIKRLEKALSDKLRDDAAVARSHGYNPHVFLGMLANHGPVETCTRVIMPKWPPEGFMKLLELDKLELTAENAILHGPWRILFDEIVIEKAKKNLRDYNRRDLAAD